MVRLPTVLTPAKSIESNAVVVVAGVPACPKGESFGASAAIADVKAKQTPTMETMRARVDMAVVRRRLDRKATSNVGHSRHVSTRTLDGRSRAGIHEPAVSATRQMST